MRRGTAAALGGLLLTTWWMVQNVLAIAAMVGLGVLLLARALTGAGPPPRWSLPVELGVLALIAAIGVAAVAGVAYLV
jgi:hypothetical protein